MSNGLYSNVADNLELCAKALAAGNTNLLDDVSNDNSSSFQSGTEEGEIMRSIKYGDAFEMQNRILEITAMSRKWLNAMSTTGKIEDAQYGGKDIEFCSSPSLRASWNNLKPWIRVHFSHYIHLFQHLLVPFRQSTWKSLMDAESYDFIKLIWCVKYSLGMVFLLVISVYWPA